MSKDRCENCESGLCDLCAHFEPDADDEVDHIPEGDDDCFGCQELWDAQSRIEALEWLVEAQDLRVHRVIHAGEWAQKNAGPSVREAWKRRENSNYELRDTLKSARDCAGM